MTTYLAHRLPRRANIPIFLICCILSSSLPSRTSIGQPSAPHFSPVRPVVNSVISNPVPLETVREIARRVAQMRWGDVTAGEPLACAREDGTLKLYMVPFRIGGETFPSDKDLFSAVAEKKRFSQQLVELVRNGDLDGLEALAQDLTLESEQPPLEQGQSTTLPAQLPTADELVGESPAEETGNPLEALAKRIQQANMADHRYGTVLVSASFDSFPVPGVLHYLAPYFRSAGLAERRAATALSSTTVELRQFYYVNAHRQGFLFGSENGEVFVNAKTLETFPADQWLSRSKEKPMRAPAEANEHLRRIAAQAWDDVFAELEKER